MDRLRLEFATRIFLDEMRRKAAAEGNHQLIRQLDQYPPKQRSALMGGIEKAIIASQDRSDEAFRKWSSKRAESGIDGR